MANDAAVVAEGLVRHFGDVVALDGIDLTVDRGQVVGLLGPNGAGKTTTVRILSTLLQPTAGSARVAGFDVVKHPDDVRRAIGLTGQYAAVDEYLTGRENLRMFGDLYHLSAKYVRQRSAELLEWFDLAEAADRPARTYSGGMRRRLDLAASLIAKPSILFLDEPTTGLDPRSRLGMWGVITDLVNEGTTVLLTTQYLEEADQLAQDIVVIDHGRVIAHGTAEVLKDQIGGDRIEISVTDSALVGRAVEVLRPIGTADAVVDGTRVLMPVTGGSTVLVDAIRLLDGSVVTRRNLIQTLRVPELLFFSLVQPVIFVLLFAYVFGGAIPIPGDAAENAYRQYLMPGIFGQTVAFAAASSTVGLAEDMHKGLIDRFRALPMSPPAVLLGRTFADATRQILVLFVLSITGFLVGWRINNGLLNAIWAYALLLLFAYTVAWIGSWIGLYMPNPETANTAGLVWLFPLTFLSNAFVPISSMPGWLQAFAAWNPISAVVLSARELFGNPTGIQPDYWPLHHAELYTLLSCTVLIAIFAPLSVRRYRNATSR